MPDWMDQRHSHQLVVTMVSPTDITATLGRLENVEPSASSLTAAYYSDTRTSGKLVYYGEGWVRGSLLRIAYKIPEWGYTRTLGTYMVANDDASRSHGIWRTELKLHSMLYALDKNVGKPKTLARGASALAATKQILSAAKRPYVATKARNVKLKDAMVLESGTSELRRLFALAKACNNRLDVTATGKISVDPYQLPYSKAPVLTIDLDDPRGVAMDGVARSSNFLELPNRAMVIYRYSAEVTKNGRKTTEQREIVEYADATGKRSAASIGWVITSVHQPSEMSPETAARAQKLAKSYLSQDSQEHVEWTLTTTYLPLWEGDVVDLVVHDGPQQYRGHRHCLVKSIELELQHFTMRMVLKEVKPYDDEEEEEDD